MRVLAQRSRVVVVNLRRDCYAPSLVMRGESVALADLDDVDLVSAMARGDAAALGVLYDRHAAVMFSLARSIVAEPAAEDIVQEVFLEAWKKAASYDASRGGVKSWLLLRIRSRSIDFRRAATQTRVSVMSHDFWMEHATDPTSDGYFVSEHARARKALAALPNEQREALLLAYFEGLTMSEIAERIGCPVGTIKTRTAAALSKLRIALTDSKGFAL